MTSFEQKCRHISDDSVRCTNNTEMTDFHIGSLMYCLDHKLEEGTSRNKLVDKSLSGPLDVLDLIIDYNIINDQQYEFHINKYNKHQKFIFAMIDKYAVTEYKFNNGTTHLILFDYETHICENILIENVSPEITAISSIGNNHIVCGFLNGRVQIWNLEFGYQNMGP